MSKEIFVDVNKLRGKSNQEVIEKIIRHFNITNVKEKRTLIFNLNSFLEKGHKIFIVSEEQNNVVRRYIINYKTNGMPVHALLSYHDKEKEKDDEFFLSIYNFRKYYIENKLITQFFLEADYNKSLGKIVYNQKYEKLLSDITNSKKTEIINFYNRLNNMDLKTCYKLKMMSAVVNKLLNEIFYFDLTFYHNGTFMGKIKNQKVKTNIEMKTLEFRKSYSLSSSPYFKKRDITEYMKKYSTSYVSFEDGSKVKIHEEDLNRLHYFSNAIFNFKTSLTSNFDDFVIRLASLCSLNDIGLKDMDLSIIAEYNRINAERLDFSQKPQSSMFKDNIFFLNIKNSKDDLEYKKKNNLHNVLLPLILFENISILKSEKNLNYQNILSNFVKYDNYNKLKKFLLENLEVTFNKDIVVSDNYYKAPLPYYINSKFSNYFIESVNKIFSNENISKLQERVKNIDAPKEELKNNDVDVTKENNVTTTKENNVETDTKENNVINNRLIIGNEKPSFENSIKLSVEQNGIFKTYKFAYNGYLNVLRNVVNESHPVEKRILFINKVLKEYGDFISNVKFADKNLVDVYVFGSYAKSFDYYELLDDIEVLLQLRPINTDKTSSISDIVLVSRILEANTFDIQLEELNGEIYVNEQIKLDDLMK